MYLTIIFFKTLQKYNFFRLYILLIAKKFINLQNADLLNNIYILTDKTVKSAYLLSLFQLKSYKFSSISFQRHEVAILT